MQNQDFLHYLLPSGLLLLLLLKICRLLPLPQQFYVQELFPLPLFALQYKDYLLLQYHPQHECNLLLYHLLQQDMLHF